MGTLSDRDIIDEFNLGINNRGESLIDPFTIGKSYKDGVSSGLSSASYDVTLSNKFLVPSTDLGFYASGNKAYTPESLCKVEMSFNDKLEPPWEEREAPFYLHPGMFVLASTKETVHLPPYLKAQVLDKSTWVRMGLDVKNTLIDPGFHGTVTLELTNNGPMTLLLNEDVGIAQLVFDRLETGCDIPYNGKYQGQSSVTPPIGEG